MSGGALAWRGLDALIEALNGHPLRAVWRTLGGAR
jgi:hypothetical protein